MQFEEVLHTINEKIIKSLNAFVPLATGLLSIFLSLRAFEYFYIWNNSTFGNVGISLLADGLIYDLVFFFNLSAFLFLLFFLLSFLNFNASRIVFYFVSLFLICGYLMLILYFSKSAVPLGSDIFAYSYAEISHTVKAAGGIGIVPVMGIIGLILITVILLLLFSRIKFHLNFAYFFYSFVVISLFIGAFINPTPRTFTSSSDYFLAVNKLQFFISKNYSYLFDQDIEIPLSSFYYDTESEDAAAFTYFDNNYPFLHYENTKDVLGNFFNIDKLKKPNFVFIITESLGRGYSGKGAYLGSFTPFLDSLAEHSLYWENFLSTAGRTFAVLPSTFASLPFGEKGFLEMGNSMPPHFSLIKFLKNYGYKTSFIYGSTSHFDNMDIFLKKQNIDNIIDEDNFGSGFKKMPSKGNGFSWGYGDKEIFTRYFEIFSKSSFPQFNIILTISMHSTFLVDWMDYYRNKFDKLVNNVNFNPQLRQTLIPYKDMLSCVLYTDDGFKMFFNNYKKRMDFKNTIFIITGDHRMPEIPIISQIDRFHVPLIIYSPMLKRSARFSSVSTQFDITPSLLAFLKENYKMKTPVVSTFMGSGLDTNVQFRNIHCYPLMRNKNELLDYLDKDYFLSDQTLFRISDNLNLINTNDEIISVKLKNEFENFKSRNNSMIRNKSLEPDSLVRWGH